MAAIRLVVFDIAGTIVEDHGEVLQAFANALQQHGIACTSAELKEWKGASKREVIQHFVGTQRAGSSCKKEVEAVYAQFRRGLEDHYREKGVIPVAGAAETFAWLQERD
ncbi:MAG TPA: HAD hydrolase-like protein, partial [Terriglobales bacterium]|nr:HAD hydrolase-like protein [Terriglobales bacterium]